MIGLLDWLLHGDPPGERRRAPRYSTVTNAAFLAWYEEGRTRITPARLRNISTVGIFIVANEVPLEGQGAWFRVDEPMLTAWVKASVVCRAGKHEAGLDFLDQCPYEIFKAATQGSERALCIPSEFAEGYWRQVGRRMAATIPASHAVTILRESSIG